MTSDQARRQYEDSWTGNVAYYSAQGCYEWMAAQLDEIKPKKVFDVGCGTGAGLLALYQRFGCQTLSIDENPYCLKTAAAALRSAGAKVQLEERFHYVDGPDGQHIIGVENRQISMSRQVMLLQGDPLLADEELFRFIRSKAPFDAVTIWLMGTYGGRASCLNIRDFKINDPGDYRLHVQSKIYELAGQVLRQGGILQTVDRGEIPEDDELREDALAPHREQAGHYGLDVFDLSSRPYKELTGGRAIRLTPTPGTSGRMPINFRWGMISVLARKL